jgi:hypothetical protein
MADRLLFYCRRSRLFSDQHHRNVGWSSVAILDQRLSHSFLQYVFYSFFLSDLFC